MKHHRRVQQSAWNPSDEPDESPRQAAVSAEDGLQQPTRIRQPPPEQGYTVLVVPDQGAKVQKYKIGDAHVAALGHLSRVTSHHLRWLAYIGGSVVFLVLCAGAFMTWHYFSVVGKATENTALREENLKLKEQLASIKERVSHINDTLARVKHLNANLQNITQLSDPTRKLELGAEGESEENPAEEADPQQIAQNLDKLGAEAQAQEETLRALTGYFEDRQALLASAPSIWPVRGWVTSDFGFRLDPWTASRKQHVGLDIANAVGTGIVASGDGTVVYAAYESGYGNVIVIDHGSGLKTRYGHLSKMDVRPGDHVKRGQLIASMGNSGRSTGSHLHYEVRINGRPENPRKFILETDEPDDPMRGIASTGSRGAHGAMGGGD
jgi:murein DD-endopeptidase MepM/ murein hydrolase activator NlpD